MEFSERTHLLQRNNNSSNKLSVFFTIICIVDIFGVFPIVALPKAIIDCGYYGIAAILLICTVQIYTASLLGRCWNIAQEIHPNIKLKSRYPYSALAEITYGKYLSRFVNLLVDLTVFSGGIPNLIVASQNLELLGLRISNQNTDISFCYWIIILGTLLCPMLWLGSPKDMKILCSISVVLVILVFLLICWCILFATTPENSNVTDNSNVEIWKYIMTAYGIIAFQFDVHPVILTIQMDMKKKSKLPLAVLGGFFVSLSMFAVITIISAYKYGTFIRPSLLETLPTSIPLHFAAVLVALQLCLTSVVSNNALYQHMENCLNISRDFNSKRCILRTILTILAIVLAESVPRFDLVMSLIGGTLTAPLVFILPPLFYLKLQYLQKKHIEQLQEQSITNILTPRAGPSSEFSEEYSADLSKYYETKFKEEFKAYAGKCDKFFECICNRKLEIVICCIIIIASVCATCVTSYLNIRSSALSYVNFSKPCIYNISRTLLY